jgi:DNA polymerase-3 subunit beta
LTAGGDDEGRAEEAMGVEADGAELLIAFNPSYLLDGLAVLHADTVRLAFTTPSRPALLLPLTTKDEERTVNADYRYLVMPARLPG